MFIFLFHVWVPCVRFRNNKNTRRPTYAIQGRYVSIRFILDQVWHVVTLVTVLRTVLIGKLDYSSLASPERWTYAVKRTTGSTVSLRYTKSCRWRTENSAKNGCSAHVPGCSGELFRQGARRAARQRDASCVRWDLRASSAAWSDALRRTLSPCGRQDDRARSASDWVVS